MAELLCILVFLALTAPISLMLFAMLVAPPLRTPEWRPSPYQPMELLMARQKSARQQHEAAAASEPLAAKAPTSCAAMYGPTSRPGNRRLIQKPNVTAGRIGASAPASCPFQLTEADAMWCRSVTP